MPKSKSRRKRTKKAASGPAQAHPQEETVRRRRAWRKQIGWPLAIVGAVLFIGGNIGARTGITFLPFDPHHVYAQFGGAVVGMVGLMWALRQ